jgi:hypothetical protein
MLERKLRLIQLLQDKYFDLHVCGSIGLFLHGIDLGREVGDSDVDLVKASDDIDKSNRVEDHESDGNDFDYAIDYKDIHFEVRIDPAQKFTTVIYKGELYRVSELDEIIKWKKEYAEKGYEKHQKDLDKIYSITHKY